MLHTSLTPPSYKIFTILTTQISYSPPLVVISLVQTYANGRDKCKVDIRRNCNKVLPGDVVSRALREKSLTLRKDQQTLIHRDLPSAYSQ
jgi:hypothetical protein